MDFIEVFSIASSCFYYGLLLAVATMAIMYFILQMVSKTCVKTIPFYITGVFLFFFLIVQDTCLIAAFYAKDMVEAVEIFVRQLIGTYECSVDMYESQDILNKINQHFPLINVFANITNIEVYNAQDLSTVMAESLNKLLTSYIWKRIGWCAAAIVTSVIVVALSDKGKGQTSRITSNKRRTSVTGRTTDRQVRHSGTRHRF